jgi:hypothetical protein
MHGATFLQDGSALKGIYHTMLLGGSYINGYQCVCEPEGTYACLLTVVYSFYERYQVSTGRVLASPIFSQP